MTRARRQHPAKMAAHARKRAGVLDETDREVVRMKRRLSQIIREAPQEHGIVEGPLRIAADHLGPQLQAAHGLDGEAHRVAVVEWLVGVWGECAHAFPGKPDLPGYEEWRARAH
jgi:hypothetical protein